MKKGLLKNNYAGYLIKSLPFRRDFISNSGGLAKSPLSITAGIAGLTFSAVFGITDTDREALMIREYPEGEQKKWNFIFIIADDLGWTGLSGYGSDLHETPNIDRFASESMKFTNAYSAAAISSPTRASLMTGKYPARLNMTTWYENSLKTPESDKNKLKGPATDGNLPLEEYTLAEAFRDAGYYTAHIGKWHLGNAVHYPEAHGFQINIGGTMWGMPLTFWYPFSGWRAVDSEHRYVPGLENIHGGNEGTYLTDRLTDEALKIIEAKKDKPFFLHMSYYTPHVPIEGKPEYTEYYKDKIKQEFYHKNPGYAAMISSLDENVGRILNKVDELGISERTVIIFYSDNGGVNNQRVNTDNNYPLRSGKGSLYEGGLRVPLIIRWPGITRAGSICDFPVSTIDFYPTFLEIANIKGDENHNKYIDGLSLVPLLNNPEKGMNREFLFWHHPHYYLDVTSPVSAVRKDNWKLLHYFEDGHLELYDLMNDIGEENNIANQYPEITNDLYMTLQNWRVGINAQYPAFNPEYRPDRW